MSRISYTVEQCAIVILAAGKSNRLGRPKQLLVYQGRSLLKIAADAALQTNMRPVMIVVGSDSDAIKKEIKEMKVDVVENAEWQEGIASSLRSGLTAVQKMKPVTDGIIFMVCDQPYVNPSLLDGLLRAQHETGLPLVSSNYEGTLGTPALFHQSFFAELMTLKGDTGARKILAKHPDQVAAVPFPEGVIDIDTDAQYELLKQNKPSL